MVAGWELDTVGEGAADGVEGVPDLVGEALDGGDCAEADEGGDEGVLDEVLAGVVSEEVAKSGGVDAGGGHG